MSSPIEFEPRVSSALAQGASRVVPPEPDWDALMTAVRRRRHTRVATVIVAAVLVVAIVIGVSASGIGRGTSSIAPATRHRQTIVVDQSCTSDPDAAPSRGTQESTGGDAVSVFELGNGQNVSIRESEGVVVLPGCVEAHRVYAFGTDVVGYVTDTEPRRFVNSETAHDAERLAKVLACYESLRTPNDASTPECRRLIDAQGGPPELVVPKPPTRSTPSSTIPPPGSAAASDYCVATEDFRQHGVDSSAWNGIGPQALPYFERIRDAAPAELRPPLDTLIAWLEGGRPQPAPAEVAQAALQTTKDWIARCSASTTATPATQPNLRVQVLNASGVQGAATALTDALSSSWATVPPGNAPALRNGTVLQCHGLPPGTDGDILVAQLLAILARLGHPATSEPVPDPLPPGYDPAAGCYVVLGR